jgi:hypothetical protein
MEMEMLAGTGSEAAGIVAKKREQTSASTLRFVMGKTGWVEQGISAAGWIAGV